MTSRAPPSSASARGGRQQAVALAGIMGGARSEITDATTTVMLEAANFDPVTIFASSERHRLRIIAQTGVVYDLLADRWQLARDMDVNYMLAAEKPQAAEKSV